MNTLNRFGLGEQAMVSNPTREVSYTRDIGVMSDKEMEEILARHSEPVPVEIVESN